MKSSKKRESKQKDRKTTDVSVVRDARGRFAPGNHGRLPGVRNKLTQMAEGMLSEKAADIVSKAIAEALSGDPSLLSLFINKILPNARIGAISAKLPAAMTVSDLPAISQKILELVSSGEITPTDGERLSRILETHTKTLEVAELENRISEIEKKLSQGGRGYS